MANLNLEELHGIIDETQMGNPRVDFDVAIVDSGSAPMKVYHVTDIFVDAATGILSLVFDSNERN